jgi:hypothetical protein
MSRMVWFSNSVTNGPKARYARQTTANRVSPGPTDDGMNEKDNRFFATSS